MLAAGASANRANIEGWTPLTIACYHGVSVLLNSFEVALPAGVEKPFPEE